MSKSVFIYNDGGRHEAGYKGDAGDCGVRAVCIATGQNYKETYDAMNEFAKSEKPGRGKIRSNARTGYRSATMRRYMKSIGWEWIYCIKPGIGYRVHLRRDELPMGRLMVRVSKHYTTMIDGMIQDNHNPDRDGTRCVYGYWQKKEAA